MFDEHVRDSLISVEYSCSHGAAMCHLEDRASALLSGGVMRFYD
jgi:hypothetical protein